MLESVIWKLFPVPTKLIREASENQFNAVVDDVAVILGKLEPEHHSTSVGNTGTAGVGLIKMLIDVGVEWQFEVPWYT
jgi:hypothetical protein